MDNMGSYMEKIGFIGYGNMGKMIIKNILKFNIFDSQEMIISNRNIAKLDKLKENYPNIVITDDNKYLAKNSNKIFIFVETPQFKNLIKDISIFLDENTHIVHICAGLSFDNISNIYNGSVSQVIPSIASTFNEKSENYNFKNGISLILHNKNTSDEDKEFVEEIFNEFSYIEIIDDLKRDINVDNNVNDNNISSNNDIEVATILSSCGPAFISLMIDNLAKISSLYIDDDFDEFVKNLFNILLKRYNEVKKDLAEDYSNS